MRICYLTDFFIPHYQGGGERRYYEIAKRLIKKGHDVEIICMRIKNVPDVEKIGGITVRHIGPIISSPPNRTMTDFFKFLRAQKKWLKQNNYDLIEAQGVSILILLWVKYFLKKPTIALIHDTSSGQKDQWFQFGRLSQFYEKIITRLPFTRILTVGNGTKNQLVKQYGVGEQKIKVINNGVDLKQIDSVKIMNAEKNTVVFVGRLVPHKHVDELLKAMQIIGQKIPGVRLKIIGAGPEESELKKQVKDLHLKNVKFFGNLPEYRQVVSEIKKSSVFVLPSTREGFGMAIAEANACSKPVVAYDIEGVRDVIQSGKNGVLVRPNDVQELANNVVELLKNRIVRDSLGSEGRKRVEELFTWDKTADEIEEFYKTILVNQ